MRSLTLVSLLLVAPLAAAEGPAKRPFEIADHYRVAFLRGQAPSPDGARVALEVRRYDLPAGETWSELWEARTDGSEARRLTFGRSADGAPVYSADGRSLYFVSDRSGEGQIWTLPVDGGEARQLTRFPGGVSDPVVSPDGRWIAVTAEVYPECGADGACGEAIDTRREEGGLAVHLADELLYRHWTSWSDGKVPHLLLVDAATGEVARDLTPGPWPSPVFSLGGGPGYAFSPDSLELCFVSNREADQASTTNADLWLVPVESAAMELAPRNLTAGNAGWDGHPVYSPDGRFIAYLSQETPGYESDLFRIALYDRGSGRTRYLTDRGRFDDLVTGLAWTPDSRALVFAAERRGRTPLFRLEIDGGSIRELLVDATLDAWDLLPGDRGVVYTRRAIDAPSELWRADPASGERTRLTVFNRALEEEVDLRPAEEMWVRGDGDHEVHVFVVKPHGFDPAKRYPLVLNVHGGPQQAWLDSYRGDWQVYPGRGYAVAFANPTGSTGYGQELTDAIACDWGGRVYRDLMKVADALAALPWVDAERMGAMGWSYGGYMMMWMAGQTDRFATLAAMMGIYDLDSFYGATEELWFPEKDLCGTPWSSPEYRRWSPAEQAARFRTPALVVTGERDYRVPYTQSLQFFTALRRQGVPARLVVFPEAGHWPGWQEMAFYYLVHLDWFHRWLGGGEPPWEVEAFARGEVFPREREASP